MKAAIVTPTIGSDTLTKCIESVQSQTYENLTHYIFLDGEENFSKIMMQGIDKDTKHQIKSIALQENVGKGWYGHRVYAACSFLVNADVIFYLDEDNWFEPDHVESLMKLLKNENTQWAYSFRKIYDKEENFICEDNCESLGKWPVYFNNQAYHIDTSSFAVRRNVAIGIGHAWYGQWGADRQFFNNLQRYYSNFECSLKYTLCYRLDGNSGSVNADFFNRGNQENLKKYNESLPWKQEKTQRVVTLGPGINLIE